MGRFSANPDNIKKPLALNINGRWASFAPLLGATGDRMTLYGFTASEAEHLEHYIATK